MNMNAKRIKVTLVKSTNNKPEWQKACAQSLGLKRISSSRTFDNHPTIWGNINKISHLLMVEEG